MGPGLDGSASSGIFVRNSFTCGPGSAALPWTAMRLSVRGDSPRPNHHSFMRKLSPNDLKYPDWQGVPVSSPQRPGHFQAIEIVLPVAVIAVLIALKAWIMAGVVAGIAGFLLLLRFSAPALRRKVDRGLGIFAEWLGRFVAIVLLAIPFFGVMPLVRLMNRLTGNDPLHLKSAESPTYWLPSDHESRRARHVKSMFCSERLVKGRLVVLPLLLIGAVLVGATEIGLRVFGFGRPILFVQDPDVGYYPKPSQTAKYPGRVVSINNHGMRAPDIGPETPAGRIRILMIGDSTLAGTKVSNDELYSSVLERKLNQQAGKPVFEVLNMGVNAWGPLHERAFIRKFGTFDADVAIICGPVANCFRPKYGLERLPFSPAEHPPRTALGHVAYEVMWRLREKSLGAPPWAFPGEIQDAQARVGMEAYADLAENFQQGGAEVFMEMLPARQVTLGQGASDPDGERLFEMIRKRLMEVGVTPNCAGPIFKDAKDLDQIYHDGVHFDDYGHRLYAEYLAERLREGSVKVRAAVAR